MCPKVNYTVAEEFKSLDINLLDKSTEKITIEYLEKGLEKDFIFQATNNCSLLSTKIVEIQKLPSTWKEVFKIKLDASIEYTPCDSIGLLVPNSDSDVEKLCSICNFGNESVRITRTGPNGFNFEGHLKDFIKFRLDMTTLPKKKLLLELTRKSRKDHELRYMCSTKGTSDYLNMGLRMNTLIEILEEFQCKPSLEELLKYCELIKPRYYTLINKEIKSEILFGIISKTVDQSNCYGHCSNFIKTIVEAEIEKQGKMIDERVFCNVPIEFCIRKNMLFEEIKSKNIICFCTGTGIAPFIAFYRRYVKTNDACNLKLVYGFRNDADNLLEYYKDIKCDYIPAKSIFSQFVYDHIEIIAEYESECAVFICGNMKMQRNLFLKIKERFPHLVDEKRIYFDNWS
ncbi:hypothetical protein GINT2_001469 [Glugoides intestinalis]